MTRAQIAAALAGAILLAPAARAQAQDFNAWFDDRVNIALGVLTDQDTVGENGKGVDRQRESPADDRSTSLVDQSSATDFVSAAVSFASVVDPRLAQLTSAAGLSPSNGAQTVTASFYALLAGFNMKKPTDPQFYKKHVNARRTSLTVGTAASDPAKDNTDRPAGVYGVKVLILNGRDLYSRKNQMRIQNIQALVGKAAAANAVLKARVQELLFEQVEPDGVVGGVVNVAMFAAFLPSLAATNFPTDVLPHITPEVLDRIDSLIRAQPALATLRMMLRDTYDEIKAEQQLSISYLARVRPDAGYDEHHAALLFDYGLSPRITWTVNGAFDYTDKKSAGIVRAGRIASEFVGDLTRPGSAWGKNPIRLGAGGQVSFASGERIQTDVQAKLTVPLASGIDVPIVYRYTNSKDTTADGAQAKVGFSIDLSRVANGR
jgi:hypothetical protein